MERIKRGGGGGRYNPSASTQPHRVVSVPLPACLTDAVVDGHVDLWIELQGEDVGRGERVALLAPRMAPPLTSQYGTLKSRHCPKGGEGRFTNSAGC